MRTASSKRNLLATFHALGENHARNRTRMELESISTPHYRSRERASLGGFEIIACRRWSLPALAAPSHIRLAPVCVAALSSPGSPGLRMCSSTGSLAGRCSGRQGRVDLRAARSDEGRGKRRR